MTKKEIIDYPRNIDGTDEIKYPAKCVDCSKMFTESGLSRNEYGDLLCDTCRRKSDKEEKEEDDYGLYDDFDSHQYKMWSGEG